MNCSFGFKQVPEFFSDSPLKKVEELLEDDYSMIDGVINMSASGLIRESIAMHDDRRNAADRYMNLLPFIYFFSSLKLQSFTTNIWPNASNAVPDHVTSTSLSELLYVLSS